MTLTTEEGRAAIIDATHYYLTYGDCERAIALIEPLYQSVYTTNEVRLLRAAAHGCNAGINFFSLLGQLSTANLAGSGFFLSMTEFFPLLSQYSLESSWYATDATMATLKPGRVIAPTSKIFEGTYNEGSMNYLDRTDEANLYLVLTSMSTIGKLQNKWGAPDAIYQKTVPLPWTTSALMTEEGCAYAGSIVNVLEGIQAVANSSSGSIATSLNSVVSSISAGISAACVAGCLGMPYATGCTIATAASDCANCPMMLRNRDCIDTSSAVDKRAAACSAAGIVHFVNTDAALGWPGP